MRDIVIRPSDYNELTETLSEKNIINTVEGNEFIVTSLEATELNTKFIDPNTISQVFSSAPYTENTALFNASMQTSFNYGEAGLFGAPIDKDWARTETIYYSGEYKFQTDKVITDTSSLSCRFSINYIKSDGDPLRDDNFNKPNRTVFFRAGSYFPILLNEGDDSLVTDKFLDAKQGTAKAQFLWGTADIIAPMPSTPEYCKVTDVVKIDTGYEITVAYKFKIWAGWTTDNQAENTVLCVNNITITTVANTVDIKEIPFLWQDGIIDIERKYELETNELFQTSGTESKHDKLSYQTYQEIAKAFKEDRRIISFNLLNLPKIVVNEGLVFENGKVQERYIDSEDEFSIYDEHNEYMGDFKVVQCNPIWDGSFNKRITAIFVGKDDIKMSFGETSWEAIKWACQSGNASAYWKVGDTKEILIDGQTYHVRIADMQKGRYDYADGSRKTNVVFEVVELLEPTQMLTTMNIDAPYSGSYFRNNVIPSIWDKLEDDLKQVIPEISLPSIYGYAMNQASPREIYYSTEKIFVPTLDETVIWEGQTFDNGSLFDFYTDWVAKGEVYWTRSPSTESTTSWFGVNEIGGATNKTPSSRVSVSLFFAI